MGRILLRELGSRDENLRTIAGMLLVKAGARAVPLLREALEQRQHLPIVLSIIGDLGDRSLAPELRHLSGDRDPQVAKAAQDALRVLQVQ